jgi:hypothetical protein
MTLRGGRRGRMMANMHDQVAEHGDVGACEGARVGAHGGVRGGRGRGKLVAGPAVLGQGGIPAGRKLRAMNAVEGSNDGHGNIDK